MSNPAGLPRVRRRAARALLLDPSGDVLLLQGKDPGATDGPTWWFTPGGGIRPSEDPVSALRRECWEELGYIPERVEGPIARHADEFAFDGHWLVQESSFYWARVERFTPDPKDLTPLERRFILGSRWWSIDELRATDQAIYPADLIALLAAL